MHRYLWAILGLSLVGLEVIAARNLNSSSQVGFGPSGALTSLRDAMGRNLLEGAQQSLWRMEIKTAGTNLLLQAGDARNFSVRSLAPGNDLIELRWTGFPQLAQLEVRAQVEFLAIAAESRWRIEFDGLGDHFLSMVDFPVIGNVAAQPGESLVVPSWMGQQAADPRKVFAGRRQSWSYPGHLSMQCAALCVSNGVGLYTSCLDTESYQKSIEFKISRDQELEVFWTHYPEQRAIGNGHWRMPYPVVVAPHQGDWFSAAERYRAWATNQTWATRSRMANGEVPAWVTQTGIWVWNRGRSPGVLAPAVALQERSGLPVSVFWHWWHGCAYDADFPEYLPPREGATAFRNALAKAQSQNVRALVYMNQRLWGMQTASWTNNGAERFAVKKPDGTVHPEIYNTFTKSPCASMCMGTGFWRDTYAAIAEQAIRGLGVNGIYMDQACTSLACYDPEHGHSIGGGKYWIEGFRALERDIRHRTGHFRQAKLPAPKDVDFPQASARKGIALAGEGTGESWLRHLDLMLSLQVSKERYAGKDPWETIPFFHAVYHPYFVPFGNYSSLTMPPYDDLWPAASAPAKALELLDRKFSQQFLLEQARAFVWGQQPTIANFLPEHLENRREEIDYVVRLAKVRNRSLPYLLHGTMLRSPELEVRSKEIDFSRLSIYAGQQGGLTEFRKNVEEVLATAWEGSNGQIAVAIASISDKPVELKLGLVGKEYASWMSKDSLRLRKTDENGSAILTSQPGPELVVRLRPRGVCVVELLR